MRLATIALALTYKKSTAEYSGPISRTLMREGHRLRIHFDHAKGLHASDGAPLNWFAVAGDDRIFHFAQAVVKGNNVLVSSAAAPDPVAVRFAWDKLAVHNLVNGAGLPAFPFRSDDWPVSTDDVTPFHAETAMPRYTAVADIEAPQRVLDRTTKRIIQRGGREYAQIA